MAVKQYDIDRLIGIAISMSAEKRIDVLLDTILTEAMDITGCDGGTVYIRRQDVLSFHNLITRSKGVHLIRRGEEELLPPVPLTKSHVCACAAMENKRINIPDVYETQQYDFSGPRRYDAMNGYRTRSMLVVPMADEQGRNIGVLQLINAMDETGAVVPFDSKCENIITALASLAAVSLNNNLLRKAVVDALHSFVSVMVDAIDARTPYNANHTRSMVRYAERFIAWLNAGDYSLRFEEDEIEPFLMSVWLHDLGKLVIAREIMDKPTRLGPLAETVKVRLTVARLMERLRAAEHPEREREAQDRLRKLEQAETLIFQCNEAPFLPDETVRALEELAQTRCLDENGRQIPLIEPRELTAITVRRGTLTADERGEMERHVVYTRKLLDKMRFSGPYAAVPTWAGAHHEFLDGTGYPAHLTAPQLPRQVRLMTILDVYDALTAEDRPYKPPVPPEKAFAILESMRDEGKLDGEILDLFRRSGAWKKDRLERRSALNADGREP